MLDILGEAIGLARGCPDERSRPVQLGEIGSAFDRFLDLLEGFTILIELPQAGCELSLEASGSWAAASDTAPGDRPLRQRS